MDLKELLEFTYHEGFREGKEMSKQFPINDPLPFKRWWKNERVIKRIKAFGKPVSTKIKSLHKHSVSVALLPENVSLKDIKDVRQYFRTHDKTMREHKAYATLHYLIEHIENS